ncbi:MAG: hypothetical protein EAZ92_05760 [Candidatus Kapaibacterium sp.]|nr:MAG: hypothetical protein EAZ92_05760 [Candidatus Kapabacteria bacterium]
MLQNLCFCAASILALVRFAFLLRQRMHTNKNFTKIEKNTGEKNTCLHEAKQLDCGAKNRIKNRI